MYDFNNLFTKLIVKNHVKNENKNLKHKYFQKLQLYKMVIFKIFENFENKGCLFITFTFKLMKKIYISVVLSLLSFIQETYVVNLFS